MKKTYHGSCHCGDVRFECDLDLAEGTSRCNCSICTKARFWKAVLPAAGFRLLKGTDVLTEYQFGGRSLNHMFCGRCGIKTFGRGHHEDLGGDFVAVNVACLDDAGVDELLQTPIRYEDGRNNNWDSRPAEIRHL